MQVEDYIFQPAKLENVSLWDYIGQVEKFRLLTKARSDVSEGVEADIHGFGTTPCDEPDSSGEGI